MAAPYSIAAPGIVELQNAATTGNGNILINRGLNARLTVVFQSTGTTSGGTLIIEEAYYDPNSEPTYAGTWSQIASVSASAFTGGAQQVYHVTQASCFALRVRISSTITGGGTVSVWAWGN